MSFVPKFFTTIRSYSIAQFRSDFMAGLIVGIVALPLAIAFAIASGVSPDKGLVTAVVAGFLISLLGGSRVQIGGPTGAFVVIVYAIVQKHGVDGLVVATLMGGVMLILMGAFRMGEVIKFIPYPVTVGFTSGIAVIIFSSQAKDFLGLQVQKLPAEFIEKWLEILKHLAGINPYAVGVGVLTVLVVSGWKKITAKIPGSLVALLLTTALVHAFHWPVETIGSRFGEIPRALPMPVFPQINLPMVRELFAPAFTIAILAGIESLLSAVVADGMIGTRHRSNVELVAQGIANVASALFGGMPATGAIARTATNVQNGGRTPVAGMVHALALLGMMLFLAPWVKLIPLACLAGILVVVSYHMSEWRSFVAIFKCPLRDIYVLLTTFCLTILIDLTVAIEVGIVLAAILFVRRSAVSTGIRVVTSADAEESEEEDAEDPMAISRKAVPPGVEVYEIDGPLFFGAASSFLEAVRTVEKSPKVRIFRMRHVPFMDATAIQALKRVVTDTRKQHCIPVLSGVVPGVLKTLRRAGLVRLIGDENFVPDIDAALRRSEVLLKEPPAR